MEVDGKIHHMDTASSTQVVGSNNLQHPWCHKLLNPTTCLGMQVVGSNIDVFICSFGSTHRVFATFGCMDLRIGVSGSKFHEETDFGVENCLAHPKSRKNY